MCFNPRPPCGERLTSVSVSGAINLFQSAPPVRGATRSPECTCACSSCFNPRPPCGERLGPYWRSASGPPFQSAPPVRGATVVDSGYEDAIGVSIRAPRAGSDLNGAYTWRIARFQSAPPVRGATVHFARIIVSAVVSIRAPRAGSDRRSSAPIGRVSCFNPRPPCGERQPRFKGPLPVPEFQSAPPVRGATPYIREHHNPTTRFNPRPPCGERPCTLDHYNQGLGVSIRAPRAGSDASMSGLHTLCTVSIRAPRAGSDRKPWLS